MKKLLLSIAIVSMMLLSLDALTGTLNGLRVNGVDSTVNLHDLAQAPLVKAD